MPDSPHIVILAGPNGAGKSTAAPLLLRGTLGVDEFVNADVIAQGLSAFKSEAAAFEAGKVMLRRLHDLAQANKSFAFETTLASRSFAPWLTKLQKGGYHVSLIFLWLPDAQMAVQRVEHRVKSGGHDVPAETILRRYDRGLHNFFHLYMPIVDEWQMFDSSDAAGPRPIASRSSGQKAIMNRPEIFERLLKQYAAS